MRMVGTLLAEQDGAAGRRSSLLQHRVEAKVDEPGRATNPKELSTAFASERGWR